MFRRFRSIKASIKNLITWFPVIWNDRQWDHVFLLDILHKKLSLMEKFFREYGIHVGTEKDADNIKLAILLLDRIRKDDYIKSAFKLYEEKYGEISFKSFSSEKEKDCFTQCIDKETYLMNQDLDMLFSHLRKHIREWWD